MCCRIVSRLLFTHFQQWQRRLIMNQLEQGNAYRVNNNLPTLRLVIFSKTKSTRWFFFGGGEVLWGLFHKTLLSHKLQIHNYGQILTIHFHINWSNSVNYADEKLLEQARWSNG